MSTYNNVQLIGNLTADVEAKETTTWELVASFTLVTNRTWLKNWEKQDMPEYHKIVAWANIANILDKYAIKGKKIFIEWYLKTSHWEKDGIKQEKTEIVAERVIFLDKNKNENDYKDLV